MNHRLWNRVAARVLALTFIIAGASACDRHRDSPPTPANADASAQVIGTPPAPPSGDPPGTTPVAPGTSDLSKQAQTVGPREGDDHSYSSVSPANPQKSQGMDAQQAPDRTDANSSTTGSTGTPSNPSSTSTTEAPK
jgi:hypothetical protein